MDQTLLATINFFNGLVVGYICICRLGVTCKEVIPSVRFKYTMLLVGSLAYGSQPILFGEWPTTGGTFFLLCVAAGLIAGFGRWREGPPRDTLKATAKFSRR